MPIMRATGSRPYAVILPDSTRSNVWDPAGFTANQACTAISSKLGMGEA